MEISMNSNDWEKINLRDLKDVNPEDLKNYVNTEFDKTFEPSLEEFIRIPNLSPAYDPEWKTNGKLKQAAEHLKNFAEQIGIKGLKTTLFGDQETTPLLFININASEQTDKTVLMYGHFDKQPAFTGWDINKGPTIPIIQDGRLYGRGSSDDGYALYSALLSIKALQKLSISHPKIKIIIEGDEESGSVDLPEYLERLKVNFFLVSIF